MIVRYNKAEGGHAYETIDFRETAPAASNETVSWLPGTAKVRCTLCTVPTRQNPPLEAWPSASLERLEVSCLDSKC